MENMQFNSGESEAKPEKETLTEAQIREHFEKDGNISWVLAENLTQDSEESCVDGRQEQGLIGTPGGNAGEFILFLAAIEECGHAIGIEQLDGIFERYLEKFGKFYMHTDEHALKRAGVSIEDLKAPTEEKKEELLEILANSSNMGCGHLKLMIENAKEYGVRPELAIEAVKSILRAYWNTGKIDFEVLTGDHKEGAVVNVIIEGGVSEDTEIPTVSPNVGGVQMFVNHPQVADFLRGLEDEEIEPILGVQQGLIDHAQFQESVRSIGGQQITATVNRLAKGLPVYEVTFGQDKEIVSIEQVGQIEA